MAQPDPLEAESTTISARPVEATADPLPIDPKTPVGTRILLEAIANLARRCAQLEIRDRKRELLVAQLAKTEVAHRKCAARIAKLEASLREAIEHSERFPKE